jgi:hypothetical protein
MPDYQARLKLGHLLNAPTDPTMQPQRIAALQGIAQSGAAVNAQNKANGPGGQVLAPSKRREPQLASLYATRAQQVGNRGLQQQ